MNDTPAPENFLIEVMREVEAEKAEARTRRFLETADGSWSEPGVTVAPPVAVVEPPAPPPRKPLDLSLPVSRVLFGDLGQGEWYLWLARRLAGLYPNIGERGIMSNMRAWAVSNEYQFLRCGSVTGLARIEMEPLGGKVVREIFLLTQNRAAGWQKYAIRLESEWQRWAGSMNAGGVYLSANSDLGRREEILDGIETEVWLCLPPRRQ